MWRQFYLASFLFVWPQTVLSQWVEGKDGGIFGFSRSITLLGTCDEDLVFCSTIYLDGVLEEADFPDVAILVVGTNLPPCPGQISPNVSGEVPAVVVEEDGREFKTTVSFWHGMGSVIVDDALAPLLDGQDIKLRMTSDCGDTFQLDLRGGNLGTLVGAE